MRTQVAIVGGGPAGLLLSHMLHRRGIDSVVLELKPRDYVMKRIRAGILEAGSVALLRSVGLGERMDRLGTVHHGTYIFWGDSNRLLIDVSKHSGAPMMVYGQTAITEDLYAARDRDGGKIFDEALSVALHDVTSDRPYVTFERHGERHRLDCDFIAGCDGFHGVSRSTIPASVLRTYDKAYPFGWLGILSETPPLPELGYACHPRGFALASMRTPMLSRYYVQCPHDARIEDWPDGRFWAELTARLPADLCRALVTGPSIEKSIAPLRSFVAEPMRYGRLFLAGDAAHIVPPTGAKGLNLAFSDVLYLSRALAARYEGQGDDYLDRYSDMALRRVWNAVRLSWYLTKLLHVFPEDDAFAWRMREDELHYLQTSERAMAALVEQYAGLPFEP